MLRTGMSPAFALVFLSAVTVSCSAQQNETDEMSDRSSVETVPSMSQQGDAFRGKSLFVSKSCVTCHSVRGVGGKVAPPFDAEEFGMDPDPAAFLSALREGAPIMVELQNIEIGHKINLTDQELMDIASFATNADVQDTFSMDDVPEAMRDTFLDEIYLEPDPADQHVGEEWLGEDGITNEDRQ